MDNRPIGIFDSGIGGLTAVKEIVKVLPAEDIVYFGDTARVPYGTKSPSTVLKFSVENALFLLRFKVKLIVVACNTSSSHSLPVLKANFKVPVIGVISPGAREAVNTTRSGRIGVIGTTATIQSGSYEREIKDMDPRVRVFNRACPLFVSLVEEGWLNEGITYAVAQRYLAPLKARKVDTLILGCTHYPLLKAVIKKVMGKNVALVDSAKQTAAYVREELMRAGIPASRSRKGLSRFYVSDEPARFARIGAGFLGQRIKFVKKVNGYV
jgi:glutamate racemase